MENKISHIIRDLKSQGKNPKETIQFLVETENIIYPKALNLVMYSPEWKHLMGDRNPFNEEFIRVIKEAEEKENSDEN